MKNLNKKISAILLSSMVVMGGVVSSGVSSFAASAKKVSVQGDYQSKQVKFYSQEYGRIIGYDHDEKNLEKRYSNIYNRRKCYNNGRPVIVKNPSQIPGHLYRAKYGGQQFVKIKFGGYYYLIQVN